MAKKPTATRVFQLAQDLGVASKEIVAKCQAEEIPGITNHMSAVSLGLAATIREWFSESATNAHTAVETAAPVDVAKAKAQVRRKAVRKPSAEAEAPVDEAEEAAASIEVPAAAAPRRPRRAGASGDEGAVAAPAAPPTTHPVGHPAGYPVGHPVGVPVGETPYGGDEGEEDLGALVEFEEPEELEEAAPGRRSPSPLPIAAEAGTRPVMNVPVRPNVVAGPRLERPTQTKLAGPKVIRVESPEVVPTPKPRTAARSDGPISRGGAKTGRGAGAHFGADESGPGTPIREGKGGVSRRNKRRSATARPERTGRTAATTEPARPFNWREQDLIERERRLNRSAGFLRAARRDSQKRSHTGAHRAISAAQAGGLVRVEEPLTIKSLSQATGVKINDIVRALVKAGHVVGSASPIDAEAARSVMIDYNIDLDIVERRSAEEHITDQFRDRELMEVGPRSPVVTILGHVDHGKTTLLDRIRNTNVAAGEAGGITQATSAFRVPVRVGDGERVSGTDAAGVNASGTDAAGVNASGTDAAGVKMITFIDTPGHEAFTEMRSRGARMTDIVVLVIAADDGVMPQTIESIAHARAAEVPIVVALNKIDKPEATDSNIQRIFGQLAEHGLNPVEWGGTTEVMKVSALKTQGVQELLEILDYQAQLLELSADFGGPAEGTVIEAQLAEGRGPVARILVQHGTIRKGDFIAVGRAYGRVRDIIDDRGERIPEAGPSMPVAISGIDEVPDAGDKFYVVKSLREAEAAAQERRHGERARDLKTERVTLDNIFQKLAGSGRKDLPLVVKADVQGSLETLRGALGKIGSDEVTVSIKHSAVGGINESDVALAEAAGAIVLGFNVTSSAAARRSAEAKGVDVRLYDVIYDLTDDVTKAAEGLLAPELKLEVLGHADVREVFRISKVGMIAGCYVTEGTIERNAQIRVTRDGIVVEKDRRLEQLKRFKDDAKSVSAGQECGMRIDGYDDIRTGDVLECYRTTEVRRTL